MKRMEANKLIYLVLLASASATILTEDCEESQSSNIGYHASGSAHSSQYVLPNGQIVTHSKGNSFSSDGIHKTFEELKEEANQFISKQKNSINIPNASPPLHPTFGQDYYDNGYQNGLNLASNVYDTSIHQSIPQSSKVVSTTKQQTQVHKNVVTHGSSVGNDEIEVNQNFLDSNNKNDDTYRPLPLSYTKVVNQFNRDTEALENVNSQPVLGIQKVQVIPGIATQSSYSKVENSVKNSSQLIPGIQTYIPINTFTTGAIEFTSNNNQQQEENLKNFISNRVPTKLQVPAENHYAQESQSSITQTDNIQKDVIPELLNVRYKYDGNNLIKTEEYSSGATKTVPISVEERESVLKQIQNLKLVNQKTQSPSGSFETFYIQEGQSSAAETNKSPSTFINQTPDRLMKIKYKFDGQNLIKTEEYSSGAIKIVPVTVEEKINVLKEIQGKKNVQYTEGQSSQTDNANGYHYPKGASSTNSQHYQTLQSQSSQNVLTNTQVPVEQYIYLPISVEPEKQVYGSSQIKIQDKNSQYTSNNNQHIPYYNVPSSDSQVQETETVHSSKSQTQFTGSAPSIPLLVRGVPQPFPLTSQHAGGSYQSTSGSQSKSEYIGSSGGKVVFPSTGSFHSSSGFQSSSQYGSSGLSKDDLTFPSNPPNFNIKDLNSQSSSINNAFNKLENFNDNTDTLCKDCVGGINSSGLSGSKTSYGIHTSYSSSSSNINGQKSENRKASVSVNDNGKVKTYNVQS